MYLTKKKLLWEKEKFPKMLWKAFTFKFVKGGKELELY